MIEGLRFVRFLGVVALVAGAVGWILGNWAHDSRVASGIWFGAAFSLFNITWGFFSIRWAYRRSFRTFMIVLVGGIFLRFVLVLGGLYLVWKFMDTHLPSFIGALVSTFLLLQVIEIRFIQAQLAQKSADSG